MHVAFIPYGRVDWVKVLLRDMQAQKHELRFYKEGEKDQFPLFTGILRVLPGGIYDYTFPKKDLDVVLAAFKVAPKGEPPKYVDKVFLGMIKKALKLKPIPEFKTDKRLAWICKHVTIILLGIREDGDITETAGPAKGWTHEAI